MFDKKAIDKIKKTREEWQKENYIPLKEKHPERKTRFENLSGIEIKNLYTPVDIADDDYLKHSGFPGDMPFLRGVDYGR